MEPDRSLYFKVRKALEIFAKINNRLEVFGEDNIPQEGGALVCSNHENYADPFYVGVAVRDRMLHFLAWHGAAEMPIAGPIFEKIGAIHPIHESYGVAEDKNEIREVMGDLKALLDEGELCCIFPTGTIKHWIMPPNRGETYKPGAVRLAAQAGVPIIPVGLHGTRWVVPNIINLHDFGGPDTGLWFPAAFPVKVRVRVGEPFDVDSAAANDKQVAVSETARLRERIEELVETIKPKSIFEAIF